MTFRSNAHVELDYDELEEEFAQLRDYLRASDVVGAAEGNPEEARDTVAALLGVVRHTAESMSRVALVLRRIPGSREHNAEHLDDLAAALRELVLGEGEGPEGGDDDRLS